MRKLAIAYLCAGLLSCKPAEQKPTPTPTPTPTKNTTVASTQTTPEVKPVDTKPASSPSMITVVEKPKEEPKRYEKPTERRLYVSRVEASDNLDKELHPFYLMDGEESTSWGFTAESEEAWAKMSLSTVDGATKVRLRLQATKTDQGYPKELEITALPGGQKTKATLAPNEEWQEVVLDLTAAKTDDGGPKVQAGSLSANVLEQKEISVSGLELTFTGVQKEPGAKEEEEDEFYYGGIEPHVEVAEIEIFVTGLTIENPAFEKEKLEQIKSWAKARKANLNAKGIPLPLALEYKAEILEQEKEEEPTEPEEGKDGEDEEDYDDYDGPFGQEIEYAAAFAKLAKHVPASAKPILERAQQAINTKRESWIPLQLSVTALKPFILSPDSKGVAEPYFVGEESSLDDYAWAGDEYFMTPRFAFGTLLVKSQMSITDSKAKNRPDECGTTTQSLFWRRAEMPVEKAEELIEEACLSFEDRGGATTFRVTQVFEYDEKGQILLWVNPYFIEWFDWKDGKVASVTRVNLTTVSRFTEKVAPSSTSGPASAPKKEKP